jgi:hypothetical protein
MKAPSYDQSKGIVVLALAAGGAMLGWALYTRGKKLVTEDLNPASSENVVNKTANALGSAIVSKDPLSPGRNADGSFTIGGWFYDVMNPRTAAARDAVAGIASGPAPTSLPQTYPLGQNRNLLDYFLSR